MDELHDCGGSDILIGGSGNDTFRASENYRTFQFDGGEGRDLFEYTGDATKDVDISAASANATADQLTLELANVEDIEGSDDADTQRGDQSDNRLTGRGGGDTFEGRSGDDRIDGGAGSDVAVYSGAFADYSVAKRGSGVVEVFDRRLRADPGTEQRDRLTGTSEEDILNGLGGRGIYYGSAGADRLVMGNGDNDWIVGLEANNRIDVTAWGIDTFYDLEFPTTTTSSSCVTSATCRISSG